MRTIIAILILIIDTSRGWIHGVPPYVCSTMTPGHGTTESDSLPFYINVTSDEYNANENFTVTLWAADRSFKGFMVQPYRDDNGQVLEGEFSNLPSVAEFQCDKKGVSHNFNSTKTLVSFTWNPRESFNGTFHFRAIFVESFTLPWKRITSRSMKLENVYTTLAGVSSESATTPMVQVDSNKLTPDTECDKTKGCFSDCDGSKCSYLITWRKISEQIRFQIKFTVSPGSDRYRAVGVSHDAKMGDDNILVCKTSQGTVSVESGLNLGTSYSPFFDPLLGLSNVVVTQQGSVVSCTVDRVLNSTDKQLFDLTKEWTILSAGGPLLSTFVIKHDTPPVSSKRKVDFLKAESVSVVPPNLTLVKLHASLMMISWVFFSSVGIITARFFKSEWKDELLGQKVWFQIHRGCMVSVFLCACAGFVIIFIREGGLSLVNMADGRTFHNLHPYFGIVVTCLTVINPLMSLARCKPDHHLRPVFNVAHFLVGMLAHISAVITLSFGLQINLEGFKMPSSATYIIFAYVATIVILEIVFEIWKYSEQSSQSRKAEVYALEMKSPGKEELDTEKSHRKKSPWKRRLLVLHVVLMLGYTSALVVLLAKL